MTDDDLERDLRTWFVSRSELPVPASLRTFLSALPSSEVRVEPVRPGLSLRPRGWLDRRGLISLVAMAAILAVAIGLMRGAMGPAGPVSSSSPATGSAAPGSAAPSGPAGPGVAVIDAAPMDASHGWALTLTDLVWTSDGGATWRSILPTGVPASAVRAVTFLDTRVGWLLWMMPGDSTGRATLDRTTDGGVTWRGSRIPDAYPDGMGMTSIGTLDGGTVWVQIEGVGSSNSSFGGLYLSRDGGISFVPGVRTPGGWPVRFRSGSDGFTSTGPQRNGFQATTDGGLTWHRVVILPPPGHEKDSMAFDLPTFTNTSGPTLDGVLPVTLYSPPEAVSGNQVATLATYVTHDGGVSWSFAGSVGRDASITDPGMMALGVLDQTHWLAATGGSPASLAETTDGGGTWTDLGARGLFGYVGSLRFADAANGWALTQIEGADYVLWRTADGGRSWQQLEPLVNVRSTPSPAPSTQPGPYSWTIVSSDGELATLTVEQVLRRPSGGYLALAVASGGGPRFLTSSDGRAWTIEPPDAAILAAPPERQSVVNGIAFGSAGYVAVGAVANGDLSGGDARAWTSTDGVHWRTSPAPGESTNATMFAVVAERGGYLAVGTDGYPGQNSQMPGAHGAAVWRSANGVDWVRLPFQPSFVGGAMTGVVATSGGYVAWGSLIPSGSASAAVPVWSSSDGAIWSHPSGLGSVSTGVGFHRVVDAGSGLLALGGNHGLPATWTSADGGRTWKAASAPLGNPAAAVSGSLQGGMEDVAAVGSDLVAVGQLSPSDVANPGSTAAVWRSRDAGRTWAELPADPSFKGTVMTQVVPLASGFTVFGFVFDMNAFGTDNLIWVADPNP